MPHSTNWVLAADARGSHLDIGDLSQVGHLRHVGDNLNQSKF